MKEEIENNIIAILKRLCTHFNLSNTVESIDSRSEILKNLELIDNELFNALKEYLVLYDSYVFIKSDRTLMFKARDIWKIELDMFGSSLEKAEEDFQQLLNEKGIN